VRYEHRSKGNKEEMYFCYGGWDRDLPPGIRYGPVIRDTCIIECCTGGFGSVIINDVEFPVKAGDCYFLLPGDTVIHTADTVSPRTGVFCSVGGQKAVRVLEQAGISASRPFAPKECFAQITALVEGLVSLIGQEDAGVTLRQSAYLNGIFGVLLKYSATTQCPDPLIQLALDLMERQYAQMLTVSMIADAVGLERCYFSCKFKEQLGIAPHQYLSRLRIRKACILLEHTLCPVNEAADAVGIAPENFARIFRKWMGITPRQFCDSVRNRSTNK
jgi:AraC-like DNA-binding protein